MLEDMSDVFVLVDGSNAQQYTLSSGTSPSAPLEESLQTVYVTSLLLVEPKPAESRRNRIEQVVGDDLKVEDRLQVLHAMLPPPSERPNQRIKNTHPIHNTEGLTSNYKCELCGCTFQQPEQYFGHLQTHSGEHTWKCSLCPSNQSVFETHSKLCQHEKVKHVDFQLHLHCCPLCPAAYQRISQLKSHHRRVHIEEKNHVCWLCNKGFYKRSDLRTHLGVHLGLQGRVCEVCGRSFSHVSNLIRHARLHTGVKPYPCSTCGRRFTQVTALEEHRATHESNRPAFPCPVGLCSRDFRTEAIAVRHARRLHPEAAITSHLPKVSLKHLRRYHCAVCGQTFERANLLHQHENQHQDFCCSSCNEQFFSISDLKTHGCSGLVNPLLKDPEGHDPAEHPQDIKPIEEILVGIDSIQQISEDIAPDDRISGDSDSLGPSGKDIHTDPIVDVSATFESFLMGGILLSIDNSTLKIASSEVFSSDSLLKVSSEGAVMSTPAGEEESLKTGLALGDAVDEETSASAVSPLPTLSLSLSLPKGDFPVSFPQCSPSLPPPQPPPSRSNSEACVKDKVRIPRLRKGPVPAVVRPRPIGGTCTECGKHFQKTSNLKQHMGIHFADKQLHRCHMCSHTFAWKSSLNKHLVRHFPELVAAKKAFCQDCGKEYLTTAQVNEHLRRDHLQERPHRCQLCPKAFYKKHDLASHIRVHTKEKPYMCGTCGKTFTHVSHVKRHELIHRGVKRYVCDICKARFRQSSGLKAHIRRYHGCLGSKETMDELSKITLDDDGSES